MQAEIDRAHEQLRGDVDVRIRAQVAALDAAGHDPGHLGTSRANDRGTEAIAQPGVHRDLRQQGPDDGSKGRLGEGPDRVQDRRQQLLACVPRLRHRDVRSGKLDEQLQRELLPTTPPAIDGRLADTRPGRDVLQAQPGEPLLDEQRLGGIEDRPMRPVTAWTTAPWRSGVGRRGCRMIDSHPDRLRNGAYQCTLDVPERTLLPGPRPTGAASAQAAMATSWASSWRWCSTRRTPLRSQERRPAAGSWNVGHSR